MMTVTASVDASNNSQRGILMFRNKIASSKNIPMAKGSFFVDKTLHVNFKYIQILDDVDEQ
jgi:hypothetical protein